MSNRRSIKKLFCALALVVCVIGGAALAQDAAPAADDAMQQMMQAYAAYGAVGPEHDALAKRVGTYDAVVKMWMAPGTEPQISKAVSEVRLALDGRFILESFKGDIPQMGPFEGMGITGFDNMKKQYVTIWVDSMSSGVMRGFGAASDDGKTIEWETESPDLVANRYKTMRMVEIEVDAKTRKMEAYDTAQDGAEFLSMEITYKKR
ncbi:MAG: DUF1579 domain-containing protein [Acidobacteria bacterium]|nr:DUF1579 domain-containing protein [Acidobacteriota bacterium]